jgi:hypothetical protein
MSKTRTLGLPPTASHRLSLETAMQFTCYIREGKEMRIDIGVNSGFSFSFEAFFRAYRLIVLKSRYAMSMQHVPETNSVVVAGTNKQHCGLCGHSSVTHSPAGDTDYCKPFHEKLAAE